ncbi:MAG: hypothetical protein KatS3mg108_2344 [Isosphaeraceae bacterium]|nr:MAG: hypothetical protein KatS3mg108_2344 [Isosphaeraceae bacterium]
MANPALWSFFGLFAGVGKVLVVLATLALVGWQAGWWQRLGLAHRIVAWLRSVDRAPPRSAPQTAATGRPRLSWRLVAAAFLLAWLAAWVVVPRALFPRPQASSDPPKTPPTPTAAHTTPPLPGGPP